MRETRVGAKKADPAYPEPMREALAATGRCPVTAFFEGKEEGKWG